MLVTMVGGPVAKVGEVIRVRGQPGHYRVLEIRSGDNGEETHYNVRRIAGNRKQRRGAVKRGINAHLK